MFYIIQREERDMKLVFSKTWSRLTIFTLIWTNLEESAWPRYAHALIISLGLGYHLALDQYPVKEDEITLTG